MGFFPVACGVAIWLGLLVRADAASPIKHVVVVMLENRAFDHFFGWATELLGVNGLSGQEANPISTQDPSSKMVPVSKNSPYIGPCDPDHSFPATTDKIYGKKQVDSGRLENASMSGFVEHESAHKEYCGVMDMFTPEELPIITTLAQEYAIMDRFFCSHPGPTWPNRLYMLSATSAGLTETTNPPWYHGVAGKFFPQKTIFDQVEEAGLDWKNYYNDTPWEMFVEKLARSPENIQTLDSFFEDCRTGHLPAYSWINPRVGANVSEGVGSNDQHPDHDVRAGEAFLKDIYEALRSSPAWNETLLVITYDEHGGFYDHVPPPAGPAPDSETSYPDKFSFDRLGIRVPTILVSPWIKKGTVISEPPPAQKPNHTSEYDLTSILVTARKLLGMKEVPLTARDAWAASFEHVISDQLRTDCPLHLPDPPPPAKHLLWKEADATPNDLQLEVVKTLAYLNGVAPPKHGRQGDVSPWVTAAFQNHHSRALRQKELQSYSLECDVCVGGTWIEKGWSVRNASISTSDLKLGNKNICLEAVQYSEGAEVGVAVCASEVANELGLGVNQNWDLQNDATIRPLQNTLLCLTSHAYLPGSRHSTKLTLEPCSGSVTQHWSYDGSLAAGGEGHGALKVFGDTVCLGIRGSSMDSNTYVI